MGYEIYDEFARTKVEELENSKADATDNIVQIEHGGTGAADRVKALNNLGIYWGSEAPDEYWNKIENGDVLKRNTIYIQIN